MKKFSKILALMLTLVMCVCMFTGCGEKSEIVEVVSKYYDGLISGELDKAAECVGDEGVKDVILELHEHIKDDADAKKEYLDGVADTKYEVVEDTIEVEDAKATVKVNLNENGTENKVTVELEEIDGEWLIVNTY